MNNVERQLDYLAKVKTLEGRYPLSWAKLFEWIAAEAVFQLFVERFGEHGASCEHRYCGVHPIGARSFDGCVDCFTEREQFMVAFYDDPALYIAAIEAALRLPMDAPAL